MTDRADREQGLTLIETLVVLIVLALLATIILPTIDVAPPDSLQQKLAERQLPTTLDNVIKYGLENEHEVVTLIPGAYPVYTDNGQAVPAPTLTGRQRVWLLFMADAETSLSKDKVDEAMLESLTVDEPIPCADKQVAGATRLVCPNVSTGVALRLDEAKQ